MSNTTIVTEHHDARSAQQLTLLQVPGGLQPSSAHVRFRLSAATRTRGLAHVAEIRRQLAESQAQRDAPHGERLHSRRPHAA